MVTDASGGDFDTLASKNWRDPNFSQTDRHPVVCVNWDDAKAYVEWLGRKTGERYRLPEFAHGCLFCDDAEACPS